MSVCIVRQILDFQQTYDNVEFTHAQDTDYYRKGSPYKIFRWPGNSCVHIKFALSPTEVKTIKHVSIKLNHCSTSAEGTVDISLNDVKLYEKYLSPKWNFGKEDFHLK